MKDFLTSKKGCSQLLTSDQKKGKVLPFDSRNPEYVHSNKFISEIGPEEFYLYSTDSPLFSHQSSGLWRPIPRIARDQDLYILRVDSFDPVFIEKFHGKNSWSVRELRQYVRLVSFTKLRISPFFHFIQPLVEQIRGLESHQQGIEYVAPRLIVESYVNSASLKAGLVSYINSWVPISTNEEVIKEFLKSFVTGSLESAEDKRALENFMDRLRTQLLKIYTPEQVGSLVFHISENS